MSVWQALSSCQTAYPTSLHLTPVVTWYNKTVEGVLIEQKNWEAFQSLCREKKQRYCIETLWNDVLKEANGFFFFFFQNKCIYLFEFEKCLSNFFVVFVPNIPRGQCSPCLYNFNLISQVAMCLYWNDRSWNNHDFCESKGLHKKQNFRLKPQMQCKYVGIILK